MNLTYNYTAGSDNGKIASMTDAVSGETVSYAYDSLNRLISATAKSGTTTVWGNSFGFDGFGNLLSKTVTGGTAPTLSQTVNTATNHINAYTYDSNGNQTTVPVAGSGNVNAGYDIQNRMTLLGSVGSPTAQYAYGAANQRVWRMATESGTTKEWFYFYGIDGQRMASYQVTVVTPVQGNSYTSAVTVQAADVLVYFGRKMLMEGSWSGIGSFSASYVGVDRLGSMPGGAKLFAWGEEVTVTGNDKVKFATYLRDGESGIDYAHNRYYTSTLGRFLSPDPYKANNGGSSDPGNPQSWNRDAYVGNDSVNRFDPGGTCWATVTAGGSSTSVYFDCDVVADNSFSGGGGAPASRRVPLDPLPLTRGQETAEIRWLAKAVKAGLETDCQALAGFIQSVADSLEGSSAAAKLLKVAVSLLTPNQFPVPLIPGVSGNPGYVAINNGSSPSGFQSQFQDQIPNADQVHHFAAFFQLGFTYGASAGASAASWWEKLEGTAGNVGDIKLGTTAALIGSYVASGVLPVDQVADTIRENLCK
jgi:RHS repeat-associated protein